MIADRLKQLRKDKNLSQEKFGSCINLSRSQIATFENGYQTPTERVIHDICREFNVEYLWITTGEGNMYVQPEEDDKLIELMNKALSEEDEFVRDVLTSFASFDTEHWKAFNIFMDKFMDTYKEIKKNKK